MLCRLERYRDAEARLASVRSLGVALGNPLDLLRMDWLSARIAAGLGRTEDARTTLEHVFHELAQRRLGLDAAAAGLELAALHLEAGRTAEVRDLAAGMAWIFAAQDIEREALAALKLFCDAARRDQASATEARAVLAALEAGGRRPARGGPPSG